LVRLIRTALIGAIVLGLLAAPALATFPGTNGKLAVSDPSDRIYSINPDGSGKTFLTTGFSPDWSPDGSKLAFTRDSRLYISNADGTGATPIPSAGDFIRSPAWSPDQTQLVYGKLGDCHPSFGCVQELYRINADGTGVVEIGQAFSEFIGPVTWSPDGSRLALNGCLSGSAGCEELYTMDPDGSDLTSLSVPVESPSLPEWSPNGSKVVFQARDQSDPNKNGFATVNPDGSGFTMLNNIVTCCTTASWAPDGTQIAFSDQAACTPGCIWDVFMMDADGSNVTQITTNEDFHEVDWQSIPINAYARPKAASPVQVSLVPAYEQCTAPNRTHGPPLGFSSCNPPQQSSSQLTVGTPDANGQAAKAASYIRVGVRVGNPATPADEADVHMRGTITDVRNASDLSDYTGDLTIRLVAQITDKNNTPHPGGGTGAATVQEFTHSHPVSCAATADTTIGATCEFQTTVEALVPGALTEQKRAIWELRQIRIDDANGDAFLKQGVFVP
jgi:hypothetical protein